MLPIMKPSLLCPIISRTSTFITTHTLNGTIFRVNPHFNKLTENAIGSFPLRSASSSPYFSKNKSEILSVTSSPCILQQKRGYAMRLLLSEYGIIWRRPEYVPSWHPEKSGDLIPFEEVNKENPVVALKTIEKEIMESDEKVQKLLSLSFSSEEEVLKMAKYLMLRRIQQHQFDTKSLEVKIAMMTVDIRHLQKIVAKCSKRKKVRTRVRLQEMIDRRKRKLKHLRRYDYKKFEWLIEELGILYRPFPRYQRWVTRKISLRKLVRLHCSRLKKEKLEKYRLELETWKRPFLEEKKQTLRWIAETEKKLGLPISVEVPHDEDCSNSNQLRQISAPEADNPSTS